MTMPAGAVWLLLRSKKPKTRAFGVLAMFAPLAWLPVPLDSRSANFCVKANLEVIFQILLVGAGSARNFFFWGVGDDARLGRHLDREAANVMRKFFCRFSVHAY
jgi:hypothetical protein